MLGLHEHIALRYFLIILDGVDIDIAKLFDLFFQGGDMLSDLRQRFLLPALKLQRGGIGQLVLIPHVVCRVFQALLQLLLLTLQTE